MSHRLQVQIPEALAVAISEAAQRRKLSKGQWVRCALELALERERLAQDPLEQHAALETPTADIGQMLGEIQSARWP
jgi:hypothetical protein